MKEKAMVLFSGGIDSSTCLGLAIERYGREQVILPFRPVWAKA